MQTHLFIFGDSRRVEGYAMIREGAEGRDGLINVSGTLGAGLVLEGSIPGSFTRLLLLWYESTQPIAETLNEAPSKRGTISLLQFDYFI